MSGTLAHLVLEVSAPTNPWQHGPSLLGFDGPQRWIIFPLNSLLVKPHLSGQPGVFWDMVKSFSLHGKDVPAGYEYVCVSCSGHGGTAELWCEMKEVLRLSITLLQAPQAPKPLCAVMQGSCWVVQDLGGRLTWKRC